MMFESLTNLDVTDVTDSYEYFTYIQESKHLNVHLAVATLIWIDTAIVCNRIDIAIDVRKNFVANGYPLSPSMRFDQISPKAYTFFVPTTLDTFFQRKTIPRDEVVMLIRAASGVMWSRLLKKVDHIEFFEELIEEIILSDGVKWIFPLPKISKERTICWYYALGCCLGVHNALTLIPFTNPRLVAAAKRVICNYGMVERKSSIMTPKSWLSGLTVTFYLQ